jgi:hypothetical protein
MVTMLDTIPSLFKVSDGKADSKTAKVSIRIIADKHAQQIKIPKIKPNLSHDVQSQPQTPQ